MHKASAGIQDITGEMKGRFSKDYSILQSKEEGDSDDDKKPAAKPKRKRGGGRTVPPHGPSEDEDLMSDLPGLPDLPDPDLGGGGGQRYHCDHCKDDGPTFTSLEEVLIIANIIEE